MLPTDDHKALADSHQDCISTSALAAQNKQREDTHKAELQKEQDEISRLKIELEKAQSQKAELEKAVPEEKQRRVNEAQKHKELPYDAEVRANSAQQELATLKAKPGEWLSELTRINSEMASKSLLLLLLCFGRHKIYADM